MIISLCRETAALKINLHLITLYRNHVFKTKTSASWCAVGVSFHTFVSDTVCVKHALCCRLSWIRAHLAVRVCKHPGEDLAKPLQLHATVREKQAAHLSFHVIHQLSEISYKNQTLITLSSPCSNTEKSICWNLVHFVSLITEWGCSWLTVKCNRQRSVLTTFIILDTIWEI